MFETVRVQLCASEILREQRSTYSKRLFGGCKVVTGRMPENTGSSTQQSQGNKVIKISTMAAIMCRLITLDSRVYGTL